MRTAMCAPVLLVKEAAGQLWALGMEAARLATGSNRALESADSVSLGRSAYQRQKTTTAP